MEHEEYITINFESSDELPYFYEEEILTLLYELLCHVLTYDIDLLPNLVIKHYTLF